MRLYSLARLWPFIHIGVYVHVGDISIKYGSCRVYEPISRLRRDAGTVRNATNTFDSAFVRELYGTKLSNIGTVEEDLAATERRSAPFDNLCGKM